MKITEIKPSSSKALVVAVGDIHGKENLLDALIMSICFQAIELQFEPLFVFLGDIVDRGDRSCEALTCVSNTVRQFQGSLLILGNHDEWLLKFMNNEMSRWDFDAWLVNGGHLTLQSYFAGERFLFEHQSGMSAELRKLYPRHLDLLSNASDIATFGNFAFVHAGIRPGVPIEKQNQIDVRWIRQEFLSSDIVHDKTIVHGHTVTDSLLPEIRRNRIALDTGAVITGRLTAAVFDDRAVLFTTYVERQSAGKMLFFRQGIKAR